MPTTKIPLGVFAPDASDRDNPALLQAENVLPIYGSYRLIPQLIEASKSPSGTTDNDAITGGHSHLFSGLDSTQVAVPIEDNSVPEGLVVFPPEEADALPHKAAVEDPATPLYYTFIDELDPDDRDGVRFGHAFLPPELYNVTLSELVDPVTDANHTVHVRYRKKNELGQTQSLTAELYSKSLSIAQFLVASGTSSTDGFETTSYTLSSAEADNITDYTDLALEFSGTSGANDAQYAPDETITNKSGWLGEGGEEELHEHVIGADTIYVESPPINLNDDAVSFRLGFEDFEPVNVNPDTGETAYSVRAKGSVADMQIEVSVHSGQTLVVSAAHTITTSWVSYATGFNISDVTDWEDVSIVVRAKSENTGVVQVSIVRLDMPNNDGTEVSWVSFEVPTNDVNRRGDTPQQFVGTKTQLYKVDRSFNWAEVTRTSADYGQGDTPQSWSFMTWGNDIIATNYVDEIQIKAPSDAQFDDLISSPAADEYELRSRFIAIINNFVVLGDVNPDSSGAGGTGTLGTDLGTPFTIWWSGINLSDSFKAGDLPSQSDYQLLLDTPGQITGLVGGEYGIIFKRESIYRMSYIGPDIFFRFDLLSTREGTSFPRSIVKVGDDIYFWGSNGIKRVRSGQVVESVGEGQYSRYLFDGQYSAHAACQYDWPDTTKVDAQVIGAYDPITNCIFWLYQSVNTSLPALEFTHRILVYNVTENRASTFDLPKPSVNPEFTHISSTTNLLTHRTSIVRGLSLFTYDPAGSGGENYSLQQFTGNTSQPIELQSGIISSESFVGQGDYHIQINKIRPLTTIYSPAKSLTNRGYQPPVSITVYSSDNPDMRVGVDSSTASFRNRDEDGWYPLPSPQAGEYYSFTTTIPATSSQLREITHLEIQYTVLGEY